MALHIIIVKLHLQALWLNFEKHLVSVCKMFNNLFLQNYSTKFLDVYTNSPSVCVIKVCSNDSAS